MTLSVPRQQRVQQLATSHSEPGLARMDSTVPQPEFQALLRYAMREPTHLSFSGAPLHATENEGFSPGKSGKFKKLIEGIHFSKKFILSYQLVLLGLLLAFTAVHWASSFCAWRRRRRSAGRQARKGRQGSLGESLGRKKGVTVESKSNGSSSSSSTLAGDAVSEDTILKDSNERTSLLSKSGPKQAATRSAALISKSKAWLVYQPRPIPVVNKTLPSNGASLAVIAFIGLQAFYAFFKTSLSLSMLFVFADRTSLLFVANLPLLYLLAAKNQPLKFLTGYSYEALNIFHRRLGEVMCLLALLHSLGMIGVWYTILRPVGISLVKFLLIKLILLGIGAFIAYELIYFTSLGSFRQRWYELFLVLHVVLQAAALILVWFHHRGSRPYVGVALMIFLIDRLVYRMSVKSTSLLASLEVKANQKTVVLRTTTPIDKHRSLLSYLAGTSNITRGWKATEHVFLTVPSLAHKHVIQAHPFTVASKAPSGDDDAELKLLIRAQDGFSADLLRHASRHSAVLVRLDGPYGSQSAVHSLQDSDHAVIVAGGSGVAVAWPLLWSVLEEFSNHDTERSDTFVKSKEILFVWVIREQLHLSWLDQGGLKSLEARGVAVEIPPPTAEHGHPDIEGILTSWTASLEGHIGVVASGPDGLNRSVRNTCASLIGRGQNISVEIEKFGW